MGGLLYKIRKIYVRGQIIESKGHNLMIKTVEYVALLI
jgi:hypothetical protein